ncbi:helix-turn-helix domain-containing protein [Weissella minor]|uniref:HTH cro/C1-type domain-containing protein n=1 Tax=Weissella minor TaxID=1620 RepID=A0A0R2JSE0_9LACO|nr:helix-turn-helix transcriptional regulator [Weissella minor]KRN77463.1 hypothetical protein IV67_GL001516 [Weissella minor]
MTALEKEAQNVYIDFKTAMLRSGFKQKEVAEMLGTSQAQVSRAIKGGADPKSIELRNKMTKILNMQTQEA